MQKINLIAQSVLELSHRENADDDNDNDNDDDRPDGFEESFKEVGVQRTASDGGDDVARSKPQLEGRRTRLDVADLSD